MSEKSCQMWGIWKEYKNRDDYIGGFSKGGSNVLHTDIERLKKGQRPWSTELLEGHKLEEVPQTPLRTM